jgi:glucose/arabinose dehydrogenase
LVLTVFLALVSGLLPVLVLEGQALGATTLPNGFGKSRVATGLDGPTAMAFAPDGRLFLAEQGGDLRVIKNGRLLSRPFVRLNVDSRGERGLLGVAVDPDFERTGHVYVYHTVKGYRSHNRISRFTAGRDGDSDVAAAGSGKTIFELNRLTSRENHNGGAIHFGPDGRLYVAVGENSRPEEAQSLDSLLGKVLRIDKSGSIPRDNPFFRRTEGRNRAIWVLGLRNPYSFAFRPGTGTMFINDVGQKRFEEINRGAKGANYGWPAFEGPEKDRRYASPLFAYRHGTGATTGCAITGGAFYQPRKTNFPAAYSGDYFFADFCSGWIRKRDAATGSVSRFATGLGNPVDLQVGPDGALYVLERGSQSVSRIRYVR